MTDEKLCFNPVEGHVILPFNLIGRQSKLNYSKRIQIALDIIEKEELSDLAEFDFVNKLNLILNFKMEEAKNKEVEIVNNNDDPPEAA
jgi:hypothetical protein